MVVCATSLAKSKLVFCEELKVKGKKCLVVDPESKEVKLRLLWLPPHMENRKVVEALEPFGTVRSIVREKWKCEGMEGMDTLNREVQLTLRDDISVSKIPHLLTIYGCQSLLLIPGRPPLCLRCNRVGHIRRQCRTPRCTKCQRYGHSLAECVLTYADRLKIGTVDESATEHLMDASEVVEPSEDIPMITEPPDPTLQPLPPEQPEGSLPSPDACTEHPASPPTNPKSTLNISQTPEHRETLTDDQRKTTTTEVEDEVPISLATILEYVGDCGRCLIEGEDVLNCEHVIECSVAPGPALGVLRAVGYVLQSSALHGEPHTVNLDLNHGEILSISCSCVAGNSSRCKHCVAVLLKANRMRELPQLSWGQHAKEVVKVKYAPTTLKKVPFCPKDRRVEHHALLWWHLVHLTCWKYCGECQKKSSRTS
ncbi:hypothetical protein ISCGN_027343 [Ixodes scapularis]